MAKLISYDVTGVESSGGGTGVKVKPGLRVARIAICEQREKKTDGTPANDIRVALDFGPEYDWGFTYIGLGPESDWKLAEFIRACQLKEKGKLDPAKQVGKIIRCKVNTGEYMGEYSPNIGKLFPPQPGDEVGSASEVSQDDGPEEEEPEVDGTENDSEGDGSEDRFYREGQPDPDDPNETVGSYDDWPQEDVEAEVADRGLTIPGGRGSKVAKMIAALRADDAENSGGDDDSEPEDDAEGSGAGEDDYDSWSLDQLKEDWEARQLGDLPKLRGVRLKNAIIEALRADDAEDPFEA